MEEGLDFVCKKWTIVLMRNSEQKQNKKRTRIKESKKWFKKVLNKT